MYHLNEGQSSDADQDTPLTIAPGLSFPAHQGVCLSFPLSVLHPNYLFRDSVGSVAFHPTSARLLSNSGSRNFDFTDSDSDSDFEEGNESGGAERSSVLLRSSKRQPKVQDASLKLWKF